MKLRVVLLLFFAIPFYSLAHKDRFIVMDGTGSLTGLPDEYSPATFDIKNWVLSVGENTFKFPECFSEIQPKPLPSQIQFLASWYHSSRSGLPHYISFKLPQRKIHLLFSLETLLPIDWMGSMIENEQGKKIFRVLEENEMCKNT